jgi:hypothetical protein
MGESGVKRMATPPAYGLSSCIGDQNQQTLVLGQFRQGLLLSLHYYKKDCTFK